jgi:hypothetical protein
MKRNRNFFAASPPRLAGRERQSVAAPQSFRFLDGGWMQNFLRGGVDGFGQFARHLESGQVCLKIVGLVN